ncbi:cysteine protease StiP family protein [Ewingella sp. S1.OA.A_B6]
MLSPEIAPQTLLSGSYPPGDIHFLLAPAQIAFTSVAEKERLIQSGEKHYSEMLSQEPSPSDKHLSLYQHAMTDFGARLAQEVTALAKGLAAQVTARPIVLTSLVRAGVPLGVCLLHALRDMQIDTVHYGISIIRDRGLDEAALAHIIRQHGSAGVVFIDGWTGKGAISRQLTTSLANRPEFGSPPRLAVLADPGGCAWLSASGEDWLMPFGILGAPISGLVSRSLWRENGFHASMFCQHLQPFDLSAGFVAAVDALRHQQTGNIPAAHPRKEEKKRLQRLSEQVINRLAERFKVGSINHIKPGIAEATRAVMRRVPDHVLVASKQDADVALLVHLAESLGIQVEEVGSDIGVYRAVTLIKPIP